MAMFEFRLPDIGEGIAEGEVVAWHVTPGQEVVEDQEMVEVMTDKATVTIGSPRRGRIAQLNASIGERVKVGSVLVVIDVDASERKEPRPSRIPPPDADTARSRFQAPAGRGLVGNTRPTPPARNLRPVRSVDESSNESAPQESVSASAVGDIREDLPGASFFTGRRKQDSAEAQVARAQEAAPTYFAAKPLATPATRKLARDLGIDLRSVAPTGPHGRVTKDDVRGSSGAAQPKVAKPTLQKGQRDEERKPFVGLRRRIAERMQMSKARAAHATFVEEVEIDRLMAVIDRLRDATGKREIKLHFLPFIVKAATLALQKHPILNTMLDDDKSELVYRHYYDIGIATATESGLVVPVVRNAESKSVLQIATDIQRLAEGARLGKLSAAELSGSTFTITSLGKQGGLLATPVLNYPEVGILGVHRVKERPVVREGQIVIGHVLNLSLSFDHRIIDGHVAAAFAYDLIAYLEQPELLLLELS